jgi:hypothetical protein
MLKLLVFWSFGVLALRSGSPLLGIETSVIRPQCYLRPRDRLSSPSRRKLLHNSIGVGVPAALVLFMRM